MTTTIEIRGGGDEFSERREVEALITVVQIEIQEDTFVKRALTGGWPREIVFGPRLKTVVEPDRIKTDPFSGANLQTN